MSDNSNDLVKRMQDKYLNSEKPSGLSKLNPNRIKFLAPVTEKAAQYWDAHKGKAVAVGTVALLAGAWLEWDYISKRTNPPERNVIYRAHQTVAFAGGERPRDEYEVDVKKTTDITRGSLEGADSRLEGNAAKIEFSTSDLTDTYRLVNASNLNIAISKSKNERVQAGIDYKGRINYQEVVGTFSKQGEEPSFNSDSPTENPNRDALFIHRVEPERSLQADETEVDSLRINGKRTVLNKIVESKPWILSLLGDNRFRSGTRHDKYDLPDTDKSALEFFNLIESYNTSATAKDDSQRVSVIRQLTDLESKLPRKPIYVSFEDGTIDWNFQESTLYLTQEPSMLKRIGTELLFYAQQPLEWLSLGFMQKQVMGEGTIRIENKWDVTPPYIPGLAELRYDKNNKVFSLFDKTNNGGYVLRDSIGTIAEIRIRDFWLHYDQDAFYDYYLDKDGNGKIDREKELIGQVLFRISFGNREVEKDEMGRDKPKKDITYDYNYSFMGGFEKGAQERYNDFLLCAYIESMMPDQLNRGYGKHSRLGNINEVRGSIILLNDRSLSNVSRALTEENALVAAHDIYKVLEATKRPYAKTFYKKADLANDINFKK